MGIMGNASLVLLETHPESRHYERLQNIERLVDNGSKLTRQLLGYAREGQYEVRPLSLNRLANETSDTLAKAKREIRVHQELAEDLWGINADQGHIEQALLNLYINAADARPAGGDLFVTHADMNDMADKPKTGNYVMVAVTDTGVGMDKKTRDRIFDPFFTTKGLSNGTGLGLASVYGTIKAHGGYIDVDSKKGKGATFRIYLPASQIAPYEETGSLQKTVGGTETVLFVDDEDMIISVASALLEKTGYNVLPARGGKEAVHIYNENRNKIDIVILDMIMPDMGGKQTYALLKEINPAIKVLLSSGYSIDGQASEILQQGCDGFIQKPFNVRQLSNKMREILDRR